MEDAHFTISDLPGEEWADTAAFGVMDGHGGREVALFCERFLPSHIAGGSAEEPEKALLEAFEAMDSLLDQSDCQELLQSLADPSNSRFKKHAGDASFVGCTAVVCLVRPDSLIVANAGDSRAVLSRNGKALPLSQDHKPNLAGERSRIIKAGGVLHTEDGPGDTLQYRINGNLNLSRAIGDLAYKRNRKLSASQQMVCSTPDVTAFPREAEDEFVILACDGIWDVMDSQEAVDFVNERLPQYLERNLPLSGIMEEMLDQCCSPDLRLTKSLGGDNMTAVLVLLNAKPEGDLTAKSNKSSYADISNLADESFGVKDIPVVGTLLSPFLSPIISVVSWPFMDSNEANAQVGSA